MARRRSGQRRAVIDRAEPSVFVVDDDRAARETLRLLLDSEGLPAELYASAEAFLDTYAPDRAGCLVSEVRLPRMDGLALQAILAVKQFRIPVIFLTAHADLTTAVAALKAGALDFLPKPPDHRKLLASIREAMALDRRVRRDDRNDSTASIALSVLTPREREVAALLVGGQSNKQIAARLKVSPRTVEGHRAHLMRKMGATSVAHLIRIVAAGGVYGNARR